MTVLPSTNRFFDINELANYIGIPKGTLYIWVHQKRIPHTKISNLIRFDREKIEEWLKTRSVPEYN